MKLRNSAPHISRIAAFDILRGLMLAIMLIDHIELYPSVFDYFTGRGRLFVSAAEGFFFLSGILLGIVYRRRITRGAKYIFGRMWLRAGELYVLAAVTTIGYALWATWAGNTTIKYGLPNPADWGELIKQTLTLRYGWGWADFLMRFCILMLAAPVVFYGLVRGHWRLVISLSVITWVFRGENFTYAWQLLFYGGMVAGYYWGEVVGYFASLQPRTRILLNRWLYILAGVSFAISYAVVYLLSYLNTYIESLPGWLWSVTATWNDWNEYIWEYAEKWTLGPLRLMLFIIWFSALFILISRHEARINKLTYGVLDLLGRNSLFVYILHSFIVFVFYLYIIPDQTTRLWSFVITGVALAWLVGGTYGYRWLRQKYPRFAVKGAYRILSKPFQSR